MSKKLDKKKKYLLIWGLVCLLFTISGILRPVDQARSQGLEGANQANLRTKTEELTAGKLLSFEIKLPTDTTKQIGFFFSGNDYEYEQESIRIMAYNGEVLIGGQEFLLQDMQLLHFLSIDLPMEELERHPEILTIQISSNAQEKGPSVWFNETTVTPGVAVLDGDTLDKSLVYNLIYMTKVHQYQKPILLGIILFLSGLGVYAAGGFVRPERRKKTEKKPWLVLPARKQFLILGCVVILAALLFFYLYDTRIRIAQNTTEKAPVLKANGETLPVTEETAFTSQIVRPKEDQLTGLGVRFYLENGAVLTDGVMHASVTDLTIGQVLCETDITASQFISGEYIGLLFHDSQTGVVDHEYRIDLTFSPELWDSGLAFMASDEGICVNAYLYFNIFLKKFFFFMFLGVEAFLCVFWYMTFVKKARLENVFLLTILFFGLLYNVMITPQMVPDEAKHIDMAYRHTNELLGYESLGDTRMPMRMDDASMKFTSSPSFRNYRNIYYGLFSRVQDAEMVEADVTSNIEGSGLLYAPAVVGMSIARLLGWGTVPMLLFARYLNLIVFALFVWFGMRMLPFGKITLFVLALLPINVQQCTSFSHDAMVHGILFFYSCLCLKAIFSEDRMNGQRMVLLELAALFLMYCKSGSYLPLCFLPLLIPAERYVGKRQKYIATGVLFSIPMLAFVMKNIQTVTGIVNTTAATSVVSTGDGTEYLTGYTLGYFLEDPLELIYMLVNTAFDKIGFYLESLIGYKLGWVEIETSVFVVLLFSFLLFLSICDSREESLHVKGIQRGWMIFLCLGCTGLILLGMLLSWTPMGHVSVEGVQGRYFLPFMLVLLTACKNRMVLLEHRIDRGIAAAVTVGQLLTLTYVIKFVLMV